MGPLERRCGAGVSRVLKPHRLCRLPPDILNPTIGMFFYLNVGGTSNVEESDELFGFLKSRVGFYNTLVKNRTLVLKTTAHYQLNIGDKYQFYQAANLGGDNGLRGYREQRFMGKSFLMGSADLRYSLPKFKIGMIPLQTGIYIGSDMGRVWLPDEDSKKWHSSYGGGLWINFSTSVLPQMMMGTLTIRPKITKPI